MGRASPHLSHVLHRRQLMHFQDLIDVGALFGGSGLLAVLAKLTFQHLKDRRSARGVSEHRSALQKITDIYAALNQLLAADTCVSRVMVVRSGNGGGIPQPGGDIKVRTVHESYKDMPDGETFESLWAERIADQYCIGYIRDIAAEGHLVIRTEDIPDEAQIKSVYRALNSYGAESYLIAIRPDALFYLSVIFGCEAEPGHRVRAEMERTAEQLKVLFEG